MQAVLVLVGVLLLSILAWLTMSDPGSEVRPPDGGSQTAVEGPDDPEAATFDGPVAPKQPTEDPTYTGPPDRVFVSHGASAGTIRGRVVAETWVVWPRGVTLTIEKQAGGEVLQTRGASREEPNFEFEPIPFGNYRLRLQADDCVPQALLLTLSPESTDQHLAVPLIPAARLLGTVKDATGQAVGGLPVVAVRRPEQPGFRSVPSTTLSLEDGSFAIEGLRPGTYDVMAGNQLTPFGEPHVAYIKDQAGEAWVALEVPPLGRALVTVDFLDGEEARARDWRLVRVQADATAGEARGFSLSVNLDAEGIARFPALPPGDYAFTAYGGPYRRVLRSGAVVAGLEVQVTVPLRGLATGGPR